MVMRRRQPTILPPNRRRLMFNLEKYLFPSLGRKAITSIEAQDLLAISKPLEAESTWISHRVVQICGKIFRYAHSQRQTQA